MRGFLEGLAFRRLDRAPHDGASRAVLDARRRCSMRAAAASGGVRAGITTFADTCDSGVAFDAHARAGVRGIMYQEVFGPDPAQCDASIAELRGKVDATARARDAARARRRLAARAVHRVRCALSRHGRGYARERAAPGGGAHRRERAGNRARRARARERSPTGCASAASRSRRARARRSRCSARLGLLDARPLLIHCVRVDDDDVALDAPTTMLPSRTARRPTRRLGHGVAPLAELLRRRRRRGARQPTRWRATTAWTCSTRRAWHSCCHGSRARARTPSPRGRAGAGDARRRARAGPGRARRLARGGQGGRPRRVPDGTARAGPTHDPVAAAVLALAGSARVVRRRGRSAARARWSVARCGFVARASSTGERRSAAGVAHDP